MPLNDLTGKPLKHVNDQPIHSTSFANVDEEKKPRKRIVFL